MLPKSMRDAMEKCRRDMEKILTNTIRIWLRNTILRQVRITPN